MSKKDKEKLVDNSYSESILDDLLDNLSVGKKPAKRPEVHEQIKSAEPAVNGQSGDDEPAGLHTGHRERVRQKFARTLSFQSFSDHEMIELLLYYVIPRADINELSHSLVKKFGGFSGVLNAPFSELAACKGVGEQAALYLKMLMRLCAKYNVEMQKKILVSNSEVLEDYIVYQFSGETEECAKLILVDKHGQLSAPHDIGRGLPDRMVLDLKRAMNIITASLSKNIIVAHNHTNGDAAPSQNDIVVTRRLRQMIEPIGVHLIDHFVICGTEIRSMRSLGLIDI